MTRCVLVDYERHGIVPSAPETVHIDVSTVCDQGCITCWTHSPAASADGRVRNDGARFMPLVMFREIVYDLANAGVSRLIVSGSGEPFLHPDINGMIGYAKSNDLHVTVITNGHHVDTAKLIAVRPDRLLVNFCASNPDAYERFYTGRRALEFRPFVDKLGVLGQAIGITLAVVVSGVNADEILPICIIARSLGSVRLSFKLATFTDQTRRFALSEVQRRTLAEKTVPECRGFCDQAGISHNLDSFSVRLGSGPNAHHEPDLTGPANIRPSPAPVMRTDCFAGANACHEPGQASAVPARLSPIAPVMRTGCFAGALYSRIHTNGDVHFCCENIPVGSVAAKSFASVWRSHEYDIVRDRLRKRLYYPGCADCGKFTMNFEARRAIDEADGS